MRKPNACQGCPLYNEGDGNFVPDEVIEGAPIFILNSIPEHADVEQSRPASGPAGREMERVYLPRAGLDRGRVSLGTALRCRGQGTHTPPTMDANTIRVSLAHCQRAHFRYPQATRLFVAQGAQALAALTGTSRLLDWRGWLLPAAHGAPDGRALQPSAVYTPQPGGSVPVLATSALADLYTHGHGSATDHGAYLTNLTGLRRDWSIIPDILAGRWPQPLPAISREPPLRWPRLAAFDTEYNPATKELYRYSLAWREPDDTPMVHVVEAGLALGTPRPTERPTVILHHALADLRSLRRIIGTEFDAEDSLLGHAVLWPDLPHDLAFVSSLYARTNRWKHLARSHPAEYAGGDALGTYDLWRALVKEFAHDPQSEAVYREEVLPLLPIIERSMAAGLSVHRGNVAAARTALQSQQTAARLEAHAAVGWPVDVSSPVQVAKELYGHRSCR